MNPQKFKHLTQQDILRPIIATRWQMPTGFSVSTKSHKAKSNMLKIKRINCLHA